MNKKQQQFNLEYKIFDIRVKKVKRYNTPQEQANAFKKVTLLKDSNISYSSGVISNKKD